MTVYPDGLKTSLYLTRTITKKCWGENMLVPQIINKPKFGVVDGKIVPTGTVEVQQFVKYNMSDFTEEGLRSLIQAGHEDYFDDSEKDQLEELGILQKELDPQLTLTRKVLFRAVDGGQEQSYTVSYLGDGTITTIELQGNEGYISYNASTKVVTIGALDTGDYINVAVSLSASPPYVASTVTISECCFSWSPPNTYYGVPDMP